MAHRESPLLNLLDTDITDKTDKHGIFLGKSVQFREIRVIRVQNHRNFRRTFIIKGHTGSAIG